MKLFKSETIEILLEINSIGKHRKVSETHQSPPLVIIISIALKFIKLNSLKLFESETIEISLEIHCLGDTSVPR